jgi:hypothetical protein
MVATTTEQVGLLAHRARTASDDPHVANSARRHNSRCAPPIDPLPLVRAPTNRAVIIYSRAPARPAVRDGPPRAERRAWVFEARRGRVAGTGQQAVDQCRQFVRCAV